jgi:hypothetical protein
LKIGRAEFRAIWRERAPGVGILVAAHGISSKALFERKEVFWNVNLVLACQNGFFHIFESECIFDSDCS